VVTTTRRFIPDWEIAVEGEGRDVTTVLTFTLLDHIPDASGPFLALHRLLPP
jgi:hypothetical protein